ncbi:MAG: type II secretion system protein, partial [Phycisphaerae bacterium]
MQNAESGMRNLKIRSTGILPVNTHGQDAHATKLIIDQWSLVIERHQPRRRRRAAFTLIELLVVISIIVLLIAILVPAAILAERYAYSSATQGDLAAIGEALSMYHADFNMYPDSDLCVPSTGNGIYGAASGISGLSGPVTIPQHAAYDYLAECLLGYLPGEEDGYPASA